ncbi:MAG: aldehyde dehydrogenase family protein [Elusimicrobiota bacterium]|jgi:succinate-semialdehyde dehydrogenase/glutarate-semialdehyde dehydrogenase|nr:aldehyde dehydrogenase family protein [Elusimicrobiota bacterium]
MQNLIGSKWVDASNGKTIEVTNPYNKKLIDTIPSATVEDVDTAVKEALKAQKEWAAKPMHERGATLLKFAALVLEEKDELAKLLCQETGKPLKEAIGEIANVQISVPSFVERAKHLYDETIPAGTEPGQEKTLQIVTREPVGVIVAIIPFNFPVDLFGQKVPSALIMGNAVIIKPPTYNPLTLTKLTGLLLKAGVTPGAAQVLNGEGKVIGQALAAHKGVSLISVTGSTAVGIETMTTGSKNLSRVMLELGGNDAFIFLEDGDMDLAVKETIWGRLYNTGQVCCASKRFLIHNSRKDEFIKRMTEEIKKLKPGDPMNLETNIGCLIDEKAAIVVEEQVNKTVKAGAKIVCGGKRNGASYEATILTDIKPDMEVAKDMEIFGPVISVIGFDDIEEAIKIANQSVFGLCGCVITKDMKQAFYVASKLEVGGAIINGASFYRSFEMPFGGWKHSGIGNEGVLSTLDEMSRKKTIVLKNIL